MLEAIEKLLILQDRDRKIHRMRAEFAHIEPERQALKAKATAALSSLDAVRNKIKQIESDRKNLELEVETKKEQITRYANQQLQTRKNEEYRALAQEIETCKKGIFEIENREITLMEQAEQGQKDLAKATQLAKEAQKLAEDQIAQLGQREQNLRHDLAELERDRDQLASAVETSARERYERLFKSKGDNVVVGVQRGVCGGCHMKLPPQLLVSCQAQKEIVTCSNCGRILYYTRDMDLAIVD